MMQWQRERRSSARFSMKALGFSCDSRTFMVTMYPHLSRSGEMADAADSKSAGAQTPCRFESDLRHFFIISILTKSQQGCLVLLVHSMIWRGWTLWRVS